MDFYHYIAFNLHIAADLEMPELLSIPPTQTAIDLIIKKDNDQFESNRDFSFPSFQGSVNKLHLIIPKVGQFLIQDGRYIYYQKEAFIDEDSLRLYILGSCMGAILQQRGLIVLHGNAIAIENKCTVFVGHTGAGKSTAAARFYQQGATILTDDVCAITFDTQKKPMVIPAYPQIKLCDDAVKQLAIPRKGLRRIRPRDPKFAMRVDNQFSRQALPLQQIIEIESNVIDSHLIQGLDKLKTLMTHTYRYVFIPCMQLEAIYSRLLLQLAEFILMKKKSREAIEYKNSTSLFSCF